MRVDTTRYTKNKAFQKHFDYMCMLRYLPEPPGFIRPQVAPTLGFLILSNSNLNASGLKSTSPSRARK